MQSTKLAGKRPTTSSQQYLDIAAIRDDVVILKDSTLRAVLLVSSINFALKSEDEQYAIIGSYTSFLNSLDFPLQIVIQSRPLNIDGYIHALAEAENGQTNELLRQQIAGYRQFVGELVELAQIMEKRFYVVIPFDPRTNKRKGFFSRMKEVLRPSTTIAIKEKYFTEHHEALMSRVGHISSGLGSIGLQSVPLDTQGLIELYYQVYNPNLVVREQLGDIGMVQVEN